MQAVNWWPHAAAAASFKSSKNSLSTFHLLPDFLTAGQAAPWEFRNMKNVRMTVMICFLVGFWGRPAAPLPGFTPCILVGFAIATVVEATREVVETAPPLLPPFPGFTASIFVGAAELVWPFPPPLLSPFPGFPSRVLLGCDGRRVLVFPPPLFRFVVVVELENGAEVSMITEEIVLLARGDDASMAVEEVLLCLTDLMVLITSSDVGAATLDEDVLRDIVTMAPLPSSDLIIEAVVDVGGTTNPGPAATADAASA